MRKKLLKLALYCNELGFIPGLKTVFTQFRGKKDQEVALHLPGILHPVYIRAQSSDEYTFQQIFINKEYDFEYNGQPKTLIDAGANIGLAAVYFANRFPDCQIICLEPEPGNMALLKKNTGLYPNIKCLQSGLWSKSSFLKIRDLGYGNWGFIVEECSSDDPAALKAVSLPDLIKSYQLPGLDIVKMDIEGSEKEVLEAPDVHDWMKVCRTLVIETHDRMKKGTSAALFRALLQYDVDVEQKGENTICYIKGKVEG